MWWDYELRDTVWCPECRGKGVKVKNGIGEKQVEIMIEKSLVRESRHKIAKFCKKNHIRKLSFFGSVIRKDFSPRSDIDILVEFDPSHVPSFFKLVQFEEELSKLFNGRKVDLRTPMDLSRYFRDDVLAKAEVIYVET